MPPPTVLAEVSRSRFVALVYSRVSSRRLPFTGLQLAERVIRLSSIGPSTWPTSKMAIFETGGPSSLSSSLSSPVSITTTSLQPYELS